MEVRTVSLRDFRCYESARVEFGPGLTVLTGDNGKGKTSILEAVAWFATGRSFRSSDDEVLVRTGANEAVAAVEMLDREGREHRLAVEIPRRGRTRVKIDGKNAVRKRDGGRLLHVTVFGPDDLELVKGAPQLRRDLLDDLLVALAPRYEAARADVERILRQRNAALRSDRPDSTTLDVIDEQFAFAGAELVRGRLRLIERLIDPVNQAYAKLAGAGEVALEYEAGWRDLNDPESVESELHRALSQSRTRDLERRLTTTGPQRDDVRVVLDGRDARTQASQGEVRSLALSMRLASHTVVESLIGDHPIVLLDDVFSELDGKRAAALGDALPPAQTLVTSAIGVPAGLVASHVIEVDRNALR